MKMFHNKSGIDSDNDHSAWSVGKVSTLNQSIKQNVKGALAAVPTAHRMAVHPVNPDSITTSMFAWNAIHHVVNVVELEPMLAQVASSLSPWPTQPAFCAMILARPAILRTLPHALLARSLSQSKPMQVSATSVMTPHVSTAIARTLPSVSDALKEKSWFKVNVNLARKTAWSVLPMSRPTALSACQGTLQLKESVKTVQEAVCTAIPRTSTNVKLASKEIT